MRCERLIKSYTVRMEDMSEYLLEKEDEEKSWNLLMMDDSSITVTEIFDVAKSIFEKYSKDEIGAINVCVFDIWLQITRDTKREEFLTEIVGDWETTRFSF